LPSFHFDFSTPGAPVASGYTGVNLETFTSTRGYGWSNLNGLAVLDRGSGDALTRVVHRGNDATFWVNVPNGAYDVTFIIGDWARMRDKLELRSEGRLLASNITTNAGQILRLTYTVAVNDGRLAVRLIDRGGATTNWTFDGLDVVPSEGPTANAGPDQTANEGTTVQFNGAASGTGPLTYLWTFGDGSTASGTLTPTHVYADNGAFTTTLQVTDSLGRSTIDAMLVNVANVAPTPTTGGPYSGTAGSALTLTGNATDPSTTDTNAGFTWLWNFGDGTTSTQRTPAHTFAAAGTYTVTLTATDKDGDSRSASTTANISSSGSGDDWIVTPFERVPNYGKTPTITSVRSGVWSDVATWSAGRLPTTDDIVGITASTIVTYDVSSAVRLKTIIVKSGGQLTFRTDVSTKVVVANLLVLEGGTLTVGSAANPIAPSVTAEIVIANQAINTGYDPQQFGTGLLGFGTVTMHGASRTASFIRLAAEPRTGDTTLSLSEAATGWRAGDRLFLPDSRQLRDFERGGSYSPKWEEMVIQSISADGRTITLAQALRFDHPGARNGDGVLEFLPHVGNLSRNVVIRSESATGTRGHVAFFHEANVDVRYVAFRDMGRTTNDPLDNTTFNADGSVSHVGTNQIGKYPLHMHHVHGPDGGQTNGYQYTLIGNAIDGGSTANNQKWGIAIHDSHYGLASNNVVYNVSGAGMVTEDGSESYNVIEKNFVARVYGTGGLLDLGRDGDGFWFRGLNNYVRDNVVSSLNATGGSGASSYGFNFFTYFLGNVQIPPFQGASHDAYVTVDMNTLPIREFLRNEAYGAMPGGLTFWHIGTDGDWPTGRITGDSIIKDFRIWHHFDFGIFGYPSDRVILDGLTIRGNASVVSNPYEMVTGVTFSDYPTKNLIIRNANIQGMQIGIELPYVAPGVTNVRDSYLRNVTDIAIQTMYSVNGSANLPERKTVITNVRFAGLAGLDHLALDMRYDTSHGNNLIKKDEVFIYDYNGNVGENYRVYYKEQRADFIVPKSSGTLIGSPVAGLTNAQNWATYGIAIGGAIAPASATERSDMHGLVVPI
jgi:PKD repeat protein